MRIVKVHEGYLVMLIPEELKKTKVVEEIASIKDKGNVVIAVSGAEAPIPTIIRLLELQHQHE